MLNTSYPSIRCKIVNLEPPSQLYAHIFICFSLTLDCHAFVLTSYNAIVAWQNIVMNRKWNCSKMYRYVIRCFSCFTFFLQKYVFCINIRYSSSLNVYLCIFSFQKIFLHLFYFAIWSASISCCVYASFEPTFTRVKGLCHYISTRNNWCNLHNYKKVFIYNL